MELSFTLYNTKKGDGFMSKLGTLLENISLFFTGAFDVSSRAHNHIHNELEDTNDQFMLLCFGDLIGIDLPTTYYALELLPFLAEDLEGFTKKMVERKSIWEEKAIKLDSDF